MHQLSRVQFDFSQGKYLCCSLTLQLHGISEILPMLFQLAYAGTKQGWQWITF